MLRNIKWTIVGCVVGVTIGITGTAFASSWWGNNAIMCMKVRSMIGCSRNDGTGYQVGISDEKVMVSNRGGHHIVFQRYQP